MSKLARTAKDWLSEQIKAGTTSGKLLMEKAEIVDRVGFVGVVDALSGSMFDYIQEIIRKHPELTPKECAAQAIGDMCATALILGAHLRTEKLL